MYRKIVADKLADFMGVVGHPTRIRIIEELRHGELDVSTIQQKLQEPQSKISQNLSLLKAHNVLKERKEGRRVFYHLVSPNLASWLIDGLDLIEDNSNNKQKLTKAMITSVKKKWGE